MPDFIVAAGTHKVAHALVFTHAETVERVRRASITLVPVYTGPAGSPDALVDVAVLTPDDVPTMTSAVATAHLIARRVLTHASVAPAFAAAVAAARTRGDALPLAEQIAAVQAAACANTEPCDLQSEHDTEMVRHGAHVPQRDLPDGALEAALRAGAAALRREQEREALRAASGIGGGGSGADGSGAGGSC
jgi:hypothetical protein